MSELSKGRESEASKEESKKPSYLEVKTGGRLLYDSFRFSQGNQNTQQMIFEWLHVNFPRYRIRMKDFEGIAFAGGVPGEKLIANEMHTQEAYESWPNKKKVPINEENFSYEIYRQLTNFKRSLEGLGPSPANDFILHELLFGIIDSDYKFVIEEKGRPGKKDKFLSFLCAYILQAKSTGTKEYDLMFSQLREMIVRDSKKGLFAASLNKKIEELIEVNNLYYPEFAIGITHEKN
jgi:hypothetical protein